MDRKHPKKGAKSGQILNVSGVNPLEHQFLAPLFLKKLRTFWASLVIFSLRKLLVIILSVKYANLLRNNTNIDHQPTRNHHFYVKRSQKWSQHSLSKAQESTN